MTREERFKMDMIDEFKQMCKIVEKSGRIISNKYRMLKALEQEPFINKSCISEKVCERDKNAVLDKIRAEINKLTVYYTTKDKGINLISQNAVNRIFDRYTAESEDE